MMKTLRLYTALTLLLLLAGCSAQDFPGCCDPTGDRDVSFSETFLFNFKTGVGDITQGNPAGNLQIVSHADLSTLLSAAQDKQLLEQNLGMVSGLVLFNGAAVQDVALKVTNADGDIIAIRMEGKLENNNTVLRLPDGTICPGTPALDPNDPVNGFLSFDSSGNISSTLCVSKTARNQGSIYYNSPGGIPDFSNNKGTSEAGSFTIFNVPAGDIYLWASRAARGNTRITVFEDRISVGNIQVLPLPIATTDVDGNVVDVSQPEDKRVLDATITILGSNPSLSTSSGEEGNYVFSSIGANSHFIMESKKTGYWTTYQNLNTAPFQGQANIPTVNLDAELYPNTYINTIAAGEGISVDMSKGLIAGRVQKGDGTPQHCAQLIVTDRNGNDLLASGAAIAYPGNDRPNCTRTGTSQTSSTGQFIIFNLPEGEVFIRFVAKLQPDDLISGGAVASAFPGVIFDIDLFNSGSGSAQELSGLVTDELANPVSGVKVDILGVEARIYNVDTTAVPPDPGIDLNQITSSAGGSYSIPENIAIEDPPYPLIAGTPYRLKTSITGSADTYQAVRIFDSATKQDLVISSRAPLSPGQGEIYGTLINQGTGLRAKNVRLKITDLAGASVGGGEIFSSDGTFTIPGLTPGLVNIQVISGDDSGNIVVRVYDQGVSVLRFPMVKVIPAEINAKGSVKDLQGNPVVTNLKVLGRLGTASSAQLDAGSLKLDTNSRFVMRTDVNLFYDTYNFFPKTGAVDARGLDLFAVSRSEIKAIAEAAGVILPGEELDASNGIVVGQTVENRFDLVNSASPISCGSASHGMTVGFFNQDTDLDLAITNCTANAVSIFFGDGIDGFSLPAEQEIFLGVNPVAVRSGDFNGDGVSDLAVINQGDDPVVDPGISILLGDRNGRFTPVPEPLTDGDKNPLPILEIPEDLTAVPPIAGVLGVSSPVNNPVAMAVGRFDTDPNLDIVVVNDITTGPTPSGSVIVLRGNGDGTFHPNVDPNNGSPISNPVGAGPTAILARNFNDDINNHLDLAIANPTNGILVLHGSADGTFQQPNDASVTNPIMVTDPRAMVSVDMNSDGLLDLAVISGNSEIAILTGNANGTFDRLVDANDVIVPNNVVPAASLSNITFGEFNGDNRVDLAATDESGDQVFVLFGKGDGTFAPAIPLLGLATGITPDQILSVNIDNNELVDLIVVGSQVRSLLGSETPVGGIQLEARDMAGGLVGSVHYLDCAGLLDVNLTKTNAGCPSPDQDGTFVFLEVPPGITAVRTLYQINPNPPNDCTLPNAAICSAGNSIINTIADSAAFTKVRTTALAPFGVSVNGVTFDPVGPPPAGRPVGTVQIDVLGTDPPLLPIESQSGLGTEGDYQLALDANSEYILKLSFQGP